MWAHSNIQWSILGFELCQKEILLIMTEILLSLFHWHLTYLAFAVRWKKVYGCCWGTADMLLACSLLWPMAICLYTYTTVFLASLVHGREGANKCIGLYGTTHVRWPWGSWWTSPVCRIWCRRVCSFPQATFSQPTQGRRAKRGDARQSQCFHFSADGSYPHLSFAQPFPVLCCFVSFQSGCFTKRQRTDSRIKSQLLWKSVVCSGIWSSSEKLKKRLTLTQESKLM